MQLVTFSLCVASAVALPTAPPTSVPKTVTAPRIPSASFLTALATQPALGNETMSVLMATMMANHEARPAGRHLQADPKSDAELMKSAVEAAKLTIGTIKDAVTGFLNQVAEVDKEIKDLMCIPGVERVRGDQLYSMARKSALVYRKGSRS